MDEKKQIGVVTHFFNNVSVAAIKLEGELKVGNTIRFEGATTNFEQRVNSMEINRKQIERAEAGQEIGLKVSERVREHDSVFLIE